LVLLRRHRHHTANSMRRPGIGSQYLLATLDLGLEVLRRRQDLRGHAAQGYSGRELLVVHLLRQPDTLDARHAAPTRREPKLSVARRLCASSVNPCLNYESAAAGFNFEAISIVKGRAPAGVRYGEIAESRLQGRGLVDTLDRPFQVNPSSCQGDDNEIVSGVAPGATRPLAGR
jgi:hypothetical protein